MDRQYAPLEVRQVRLGAELCKPERGFLRRVGPDDPATHVMTDFMVIPAAVTDASRTIDRASELMKLRGLFSVSQIALQLGVELKISEVANTFTEIEAALSR